MSTTPTASAPGSHDALAGAITTRNTTLFSCRPGTRLVPMHVLVLGLCRTGTSSLKFALELLLRPSVYHMDSLAHVGPGEADAWLAAFASLDAERRAGQEPSTKAGEEEIAFWNKMTGHVAAVTDIPCALFYAQLLRCYPDAAVVLSVRSPAPDEEDSPRHLHGAHAFATSTHNTILQMRRKLWWMAPGWLSDVFVRIVPLPRAMLVRRKTLSVLFGDDVCADAPEREIAIAEEAYRKHNSEVVGICERMRREVLVYNVSEGWEPLVEFLNKRRGEGETLSVPVYEDGREVPFPRLNDTKTFHRIVAEKAMQTKQATKENTRNRLRIIGTVVLGAVVAVAIALWLRKTSN